MLFYDIVSEPRNRSQFQKDKIDGTDLYKNKHGLPIDIRKEILPIYYALTKPELLKKCLHGKTQNANESFNGIIWNRIPKATHDGDFCPGPQAPEPYRPHNGVLLSFKS